jgi:hypothetical protein
VSITVLFAICFTARFNISSIGHMQHNIVIAIAACGCNSLALIGDGPPVMRVSVEAQWTPDGLAVAVPTRSGRVCALEFTPSLERSDWTLLPLVAGDGSVRLLTDFDKSDNQRFYRVRAW